MSAGRPAKYKNWVIQKADYSNFTNNDFKSEKDLRNFIIWNIDNVCKDIYNDKVKDYKVDFSIQRQLKRSPRGRRIDLIIFGENNNYLIELKNPKSGTENRAAIGQILDYGREFMNYKLSIITTKFDIDTAETIKYYNLPIRYIYTNKKQCAEFMGKSV